jgi:hypothetical protein
MSQARQRLATKLATLTSMYRLSDAALARRAKCGRGQLRAVYRGTRACSVDLLARLGWALMVEPAELVDSLERSSVRPPPTCMSADSLWCPTTDAPVELRRVVAANLRAVARARFGEVHPVRLAAALGLQWTAVYALLTRKQNPCIDRIEEIATRLGTTPSDILRAPA